MKLTIDFETRSRCDLKKAGAWKYAEDESTDVICLALKVDNGQVYVYVPNQSIAEICKSLSYAFVNKAKVDELVSRADIVEAHNAQFELAIWDSVLTKRYGFDPFPLEKLWCSAARAALVALPRSLDGACKAAKTTVQKDMNGHRVMLKLCKPSLNGAWNQSVYDFDTLFRYCVTDVESEYALSEALPKMNQFEKNVWQLDAKINQRGVQIDVPVVEEIIKRVKNRENELLLEFVKLTKGKVKSPRQVAVLKKWLSEEEDIEVENLNKTTVGRILAEMDEGVAKRVLEIRALLGKSSVAKFTTMKNMASSDGKIRGMFLFSGAGTRRWSGKGVQLQNLPRDSYKPKDLEDCVSMPDALSRIVYDDPMLTASKCIRGSLIASPGKTFYCADFSAIEARVVAWLANEKRTLDVFRSGGDVYKVEAAGIYQRSPESVTKDQRQIGKVAVLSLGYQGWIGAFDNMAKAYGVKVPEAQAKEIILSWRRNNPNIVAFWDGVFEAALQAVKSGGQCSYGPIRYFIRSEYLVCRLPSGNHIAYPNPTVQNVTTKYRQEKTVIGYWGVDAKTKRWSQQYAYGGMLTENIVQSLARDFLAEAMLRVDPTYPVVMHIHDEIVSERNEGEGSLREFESLVSALPAWAHDCPISAEGWTGKRYRK